MPRVTHHLPLGNGGLRAGLSGGCFAATLRARANPPYGGCLTSEETDLAPGAAASRRRLLALEPVISVRGTRTLLFGSPERIVRSIEVVGSLKPAVRLFR